MSTMVTAIAPNCTLKPSLAPSSTGVLLAQVLAALASEGVATWVGSLGVKTVIQLRSALASPECCASPWPAGGELPSAMAGGRPLPSGMLSMPD